VHDGLARHAGRGQQERGHPPGPVRPAGAVVEERAAVGRVGDHPHRRAEPVPLPLVGDETAVGLDHEVGGAPVAEHLFLEPGLAAGDQVGERAEFPAGHRQAHGRHSRRQPVRSAQQDLARRPEVDDRAQPQVTELGHVGLGQAAEGITTEHPATGHLGPEHTAVTADVPYVLGAIERYEAARHAAMPGPVTRGNSRSASRRAASATASSRRTRRRTLPSMLCGSSSLPLTCEGTL
jgi:hypothetical protein